MLEFFTLLNITTSSKFWSKFEYLYPVPGYKIVGTFRLYDENDCEYKIFSLRVNQRHFGWKNVKIVVVLVLESK